MVLNIFAYIKLCEYTQIAVANIQFFYYFFQILSLNGIKDFKQWFGKKISGSDTCIGCDEPMYRRLCHWIFTFGANLKNF